MCLFFPTWASFIAVEDLSVEVECQYDLRLSSFGYKEAGNVRARSFGGFMLLNFPVEGFGSEVATSVRARPRGPERHERPRCAQCSHHRHLVQQNGPPHRNRAGDGERLMPKSARAPWTFKAQASGQRRAHAAPGAWNDFPVLHNGSCCFACWSPECLFAAFSDTFPAAVAAWHHKCGPTQRATRARMSPTPTPRTILWACPS